jgi:hypothetical protein
MNLITVDKPLESIICDKDIIDALGNNLLRFRIKLETDIYEIVVNHHNDFYGGDYNFTTYCDGMFLDNGLINWQSLIGCNITTIVIWENEENCNCIFTKKIFVNLLNDTYDTIYQFQFTRSYNDSGDDEDSITLDINQYESGDEKPIPIYNNYWL